MTVTTDARPGKPRERTCIGCRKRSGPADLLRMTVSGGLVLPDPDRRAPGRGAHLHPVAECLDLAVRRKAFPRAFRVPGPLDVTGLQEYVAQRDKQEVSAVQTAATRPPAAVQTAVTT
ncbi:YlxR family protein [Kribbella capetownensis]|uniref:YlxR family protein n=1 Tax=Kribbella capetownensis TaxID=1572659 RepID=A0A4R0JRP5_9ACTN|nr:YlxR family protein [Kribbella capetownensis]